MNETRVRVTLALALFSSIAIAGEPVGKVASVQNQVETRRSGAGDWSPSALNQSLGHTVAFFFLGETFAPNRHLSISVGCDHVTSVDDLCQFSGRERSVSRFRYQGQVSGLDRQRGCCWPISACTVTVTRRTRFQEVGPSCLCDRRKFRRLFCPARKTSRRE